MNLVTDNKKNFRMVKIIAYATMVFSPVVYVFIPVFVEAVPQLDGAEHILFYILYFLAMVVPSLSYIIEKYYLSDCSRNTVTSDAEKIYFSISVMKFSMTLSVYIFGLIVFFITGDASRFYMYYPIGIIWTFIHWPTEKKYNDFMNKCKKDIYAK